MLKWIGENDIYQSFDMKSLANLYLQSAQMMETKALCLSSWTVTVLLQVLDADHMCIQFVTWQKHLSFSSNCIVSVEIKKSFTQIRLQALTQAVKVCAKL